MTTAARFTCFAHLPPELRFQIWTMALTAEAVWAANKVTLEGRPDKMTFIGPSPPLAGLACKEAWHLMEQVYARPVQGRSGEKGTWVGLGYTILALGRTQNRVTLLDHFSADDSLRIQHVAVHWTTWGRLVRDCMRLAKACPALQTLIIQRMELDAQPQPLTVERAAFYGALLQFKESYFGDSIIDGVSLRQHLGEHFEDSIPIIHLVEYPGRP
ncbi:hypothetical protein CC79DRAFT_1062558 [Sarocladium strictum]